MVWVKMTPCGYNSKHMVKAMEQSWIIGALRNTNVCCLLKKKQTAESCAGGPSPHAVFALKNATLLPPMLHS